MTGPKLGRSLIKRMGGKTYPVERAAAGSYVDGVWVETPESYSQATALDPSGQLRFTSTLFSEEGNGKTVSFVVDDAFPVVPEPENFIQDEDGNLTCQVNSATLPDDLISGWTDNSLFTLSLVKINDQEPLIADVVTLSGGGPVYPSPTAFASKQPLAGHEIVRIPEGDRTRQRFKLYSADHLRVHDEATGAIADVVILPEGKFQVESVEPWTNFWKAIIVKIEQK